MTIPELSGPADLYYNSEESRKYHRNSRISKIQTELTHRAIDLLEIDDENAAILDLGCGSGLSGGVIAECNHSWMGADISLEMLKIAGENASNCLGLVCLDMGTRFPFLDESFDYGVSVSAVQWLFQSYKKEDYPLKRIKEFFRSLHRVIRKRAVLQFYCGKKETEILKREAKLAGFHGGIVVDEEGTKNCKVFLVLDKNRYSLRLLGALPADEEIETKNRFKANISRKADGKRSGDKRRVMKHRKSR